MTTVLYGDLAAAVAVTGMRARGGFAVGDHEPDIAPQRDGSPTRTVVVIGNVGGEMWPAFRAAEPPGRDPLDTWTRACLEPIAERFGARFVHPSDEPFVPIQRWAQRADDVWPSPIGLLVHPEFGLWHAYRGALLVGEEIEGLPPLERSPSPCVDCADQPCLSTCPVGAFTASGYDVVSCRRHVVSAAPPACLTDGCQARLACPLGRPWRYGPDQMAFHMRAFAGVPA